MTNESFNLDPSGENNFSLDDYRLTEAEATHVDRWLGAAEGVEGWSPVTDDSANAAPTPRLAEIIALLGQVREPKVPAGLAQRTIAAVNRHTAMDRLVAAVGAAHPGRKIRIGWDRRKIDLAAMTVAAGLLFVILISGINHARFVANRTACAGNLSALASAFSGYAANNADMLPRIAPPADGDWLPRADTPGQRRSANAHSNLANLQPMLARGAFVAWKRLICPSCQVAHNLSHVVAVAHGLPTSDMSYSYLDQLAPYHHHWNGSGRVVVMADYNPLFVEGVGPVRPESNSFNHARRGENILYDDGSVRWVGSPNVGPRSDNIWTVQGNGNHPYTGHEEPRSPYDILVVP